MTAPTLAQKRAAAIAIWTLLSRPLVARPIPEAARTRRKGRFAGKGAK